MDRLLHLLSNLSQSPDQFRLLFILLVGAAVFMLVMGVVGVYNLLRDPIRRRLHAVDAGAGMQPQRSLFVEERRNPLAPYLVPKNEGERSKISAQLTIAGYPGSYAVAMFYTIKTALTVLLPLALLIITNATTPLDNGKLLLYMMVAAGVGMLLPNYILGKMTARRQKRLRNGFPDALDLLVVCVESGLGLNAALQRVAREIIATYPDLAEEMSIVNAEIRAGVPRTEALRNLAERTGLDDIRGLVSLLAQSMRFGTSIADALRIYAEEFRDKRMQQAEEQAAKIGTKMIFPLVLCLFPAFFLVAVGPAVIRLTIAFSRL